MQKDQNSVVLDAVPRKIPGYVAVLVIVQDGLALEFADGELLKQDPARTQSNLCTASQCAKDTDLQHKASKKRSQGTHMEVPTKSVNREGLSRSVQTRGSQEALALEAIKSNTVPGQRLVKIDDV